MIFPDFYNRVQINANTEKASNGNIIKSTFMVNIRADSVAEGVKLYRDLQKQLNENPDTGDQKNNEHAGNRNNQEIKTFPQCEDHHVTMLLRSRKSDGALFFGCPYYQEAGCLSTAPAY